MNLKYKKYNNYIKIDQLMNMDWSISNAQLNMIVEVTREIRQNETVLESMVGSEWYLPIFLKQLLYFEQNKNSNVEGSQTQFDELFEIEDEFKDNYSWETRNLIDVGIEVLKDLEQNTFSFNYDSITNLHKKLYATNSNKTSFDNEKYLEKIKPGYVLQKGDPINWIGNKTNDRENDVKKALLISVIPEEKSQKLKELIKRTRGLIDKKELSIMDISRFHVIFEGIHPFADGNGRLGRLIIMILLQLSGVTTNTILPISEYIYREKDEYIRELNNVQVTGDYDKWNYYFIHILLSAKKIHQSIIFKIRNLVSKYKPLIKEGNQQIVFAKFIKHIKLDKDVTIKKLISEGMSSSTAYRKFDEIIKIVQAKKEGRYYVFEEMWEIYRNN